MKRKTKVTNEMLAMQLHEALQKLKIVQEWMATHEVSDNNRFEEGADNFRKGADNFKKLSDAVFNSDGSEKLASKDDIQEILDVFKNIETGALVVQAGGKWTFRALLVIAAMVAALTTIFGGWKALIGVFLGNKL